MNYDLVLCGVGGQGVLSTAYVVDHAAVEAGLHVKQPEVHGMAQRGGAVSAQVRLADAPVLSDLISDGGASLVLSVEPMESLRYMKLLRADGWVVTDVTPLKNISAYPDLGQLYGVLFSLPRVLVVDATRLATKAGVMKAQNMVVLGAAASLLPVGVPMLEKHITALFTPRGERLVASNLRAFRMGLVASAFGAALRAREVPAAVVARVVARLDVDQDSVPQAVIDAWATRLSKADGAAVAMKVFDAANPVPVDAQFPSTL
jgi:indolepyruvate ferredoxin oxidoreductase beta subunit